MSTPQEPGVRDTQELPNHPALYEGVSHSNTARQYAKRLMKLIRSGKRLDRDDMTWLNRYNLMSKKKTSDDDDDGETSYNGKDIHMFFMDKITTLQISYDAKIEKITLRYEEQISKKDQRIDELTASAERRRDESTTEILKLVSGTYRESLATVEKAHGSSNKNLSEALTTSTKLNETLTSSYNEKLQRLSDKERKYIDELQKMSEKEESPGFFDLLVQEFLIPNKDKIGEALSRFGKPLLTEK